MKVRLVLNTSTPKCSSLGRLPSPALAALLIQPSSVITVRLLGLEVLACKIELAAVQISMAVLALVARLVLLAIAVGSAAGDSEEPETPVCRRIAKDMLGFCSMVDYMAVVDATDLDGSAADARAKSYYDSVHVLLQRFGCHNKYSLYGCDDCRDAYKYWICSVKFQKCGSAASTASGSSIEDPTAFSPQLCPQTASASVTATGESKADTETMPCTEGVTGRFRTCLSLCEDVVRKCPYVLNFQCPTVSILFAWIAWTKLQMLDLSCDIRVADRDELLLQGYHHLQQARPRQEPGSTGAAMASHVRLVVDRFRLVAHELCAEFCSYLSAASYSEKSTCRDWSCWPAYTGISSSPHTIRTMSGKLRSSFESESMAESSACSDRNCSNSSGHSSMRDSSEGIGFL